MQLTDIDLESIVHSLRTTLGNDWQFAMEYLSPNPKNPSMIRPDLVITDPQEHNFIVEFKGLSQESELPLAIVPILRKIKKVNRELKPEMILATTSTVPSYLKDELTHDNVNVVNFSDKDDVVSKILDIVSPEKPE